MLRIVTAAVLLSVLWPVTEVGPAWMFHLLVAAAVGLGTWECYRLLERRGARPLKSLGLVCALALVWSASGLRPSLDVLLPLAVITVATPVVAFWRRPDPEAMLAATWSTLLPVVLVGLSLSFLSRLRAVPGEDGKDLVYLLFFCVILADTAAFYVGTMIGRHRMAPRISPKKSWEGALGGVAASVAGALVASVWFFTRLTLADAVVLGLVLGLASILGDLTESMVKRASGAKDSSWLLPGHGGVLDRTDSLLFSAPVLYYYYAHHLLGLAGAG